MSDVRWGILGAANFARNHMGPAIAAAPGGRLAAVATRDALKAEPFKAFAPGLKVLPSYEAMLEDPAIDAVYIPLPNALHVDWSLRAMAAGKHVLCEKPVAMETAEIDRLIDARDRAGVLMAEAYMIVFHPQWQRVRHLLSEGAVGRLWSISGAFSFNNRDLRNIRNQAAMGGGSLRDIGVYTFGSARYATGLEPEDIAASIRYEDGVDTYARVTARFGGADYAMYTSIRIAPRQEMVFHGEDAVLRVTVPFNARVFGEPQIVIEAGTDTRIERFPHQNQYELQVAAFNSAVTEGTRYPCPLEFSRGTQAMMDAAFDSDPMPQTPFPRTVEPSISVGGR